MIKEKEIYRQTRNDFLVYGKPKIEQDEIDEVVSTLKSGWIGLGPKTHQFEKEFQKYIGAKHAKALSSCTAGLHLSLVLADIHPGDEVITTPMTFAATANVIENQGATPIFADIDIDSWNIDPNEIKKRITNKTKALLPVHYAGRPCKMDELLEIKSKYDLYLIEDAAHAIEAKFKGMKIGNVGDITAFSFYVTKNINTIEGGMVTTNNDSWAEKLEFLSYHGMTKDAWKRYTSKGFYNWETLTPGFKYNMTDIQASLGIHQLKKINKNHDYREKLWKSYNEEFENEILLIKPIEEKGIIHARHLYTLLLKIENMNCTRNEFCAALQSENIGIGVHYIALHLHKYYREKYGFKKGMYPNSEYVSDRTFSIPLSPNVTEEDQKDVISTIKKALRKYKK